MFADYATLRPDQLLVSCTDRDFRAAQFRSLCNILNAGFLLRGLERGSAAGILLPHG